MSTLKTTRSQSRTEISDFSDESFCGRRIFSLEQISWLVDRIFVFADQRSQFERHSVHRFSTEFKTFPTRRSFLRSQFRAAWLLEESLGDIEYSTLPARSGWPSHLAREHFRGFHERTSSRIRATNNSTFRRGFFLLEIVLEDFTGAQTTIESFEFQFASDENPEMRKTQRICSYFVFAWNSKKNLGKCRSRLQTKERTIL